VVVVVMVVVLAIVIVFNDAVVAVVVVVVGYRIRFCLYFLRHCRSHVMIASQSVLVLSCFHVFRNTVAFEDATYIET